MKLAMPTFRLPKRQAPGRVAWLPRLVEAGLALMMAWVVAGWIAGSGAGHDTGPQPKKEVAPDRAASGHASVSEQALASIPLFGRQEKKANPKPVVVAAPSKLNIQLTGTLLAGNHSAAVLRLANGRQKLVFLGESVQPGVVLKEVYAADIVVDNHGRLERIAMPRNALAGHAPIPAGPANSPIPAGYSGSSMVSDNERRRVVHVSRAMLNRQLDQLPTLLTQARAIPHQTDGKPDGFLIREIVPGSLYDKAGLKNGDVIRKVNGVPVTRPEQGVQLYRMLRNVPAIELEISRNGVPQTLHYDIR